MKLFPFNEVPEGVQELRCRQSRLAGVVSFIVWCGVLAVAPILGWRLGKPWLLWTGAALAAIVIPWMLADLAAKFRATNWLLLIRPDGVWINLRSYRDSRPGATPVVRLDYAEIASAGRHTESYSSPSKQTGQFSRGPYGASTIWNDVYLEFRLNHEQAGELSAALHQARYGEPAEETPSGGASVPRPARPLPLWLVSPSVLRIAWRSGHGHVVAPPLPKALRELDGYVTIAESSRRKRPNWRELTREEVEELARELIHVHGARLEAGNLLGRTRGLTPSESDALVRRYEAEGARSRAGQAPH